MYDKTDPQISKYITMIIAPCGFPTAIIIYSGISVRDVFLIGMDQVSQTSCQIVR